MCVRVCVNMYYLYGSVSLTAFRSTLMYIICFLVSGPLSLSFSITLSLTHTHAHTRVNVKLMTCTIDSHKYRPLSKQSHNPSHLIMMQTERTDTGVTTNTNERKKIEAPRVLQQRFCLEVLEIRCTNGRTEDN